MMFLGTRIRRTLYQQLPFLVKHVAVGATTTTTEVALFRQQQILSHHYSFPTSQQQQLRSVQYIVNPKALHMMKCNEKKHRATVAMLDYYKRKREERIVFHWFRLGDLRLYDNATLFRAAEVAYDSRLAERRKRSPPKDDPCYIVPIFCFDTATIFGNTNKTPSNDLKMNARRAKFILESVMNVRKRLEEEYNSKLVIGLGDPKIFFDSIVKQIDASIPIKIFVQDEPIREKRKEVHDIQRLVIARPKSDVFPVWDSSLFDPQYIHFGGKNVTDLPNDPNEFRKQIEKRGKKRHPIYPVPQYLLYPEEDSIFYPIFESMTQYIPTLQDLGYTPEQIAEVQNDSNSDNDGDGDGDDDDNTTNQMKDDPRSAIRGLRGGENAAKERLNEYFWNRDLLKAAYTTRDTMMPTIEYSSKLSLYLSHGCISPKLVLEEIKRYRKSRISNMSTYWYEYELIRRDYCKLYFVKHGSKVFLPGGPINNTETEWNTNMEQLTAWKEGRTGYPIVDACMRELKATGYMSKMGRKITSYFLTYFLQHDWRNGADWFESQLIDHDVYSNWTNWCSMARGTGAEIPHICPLYRSEGNEHFIRLWVPELRNLPKPYIYKPWVMNEVYQAEYNVKLGIDYPHRIVQLRDPPVVELTEQDKKAIKKKKRRLNRIIRKKKM